MDKTTYLNGQNLTKLPKQFGIVSGHFDCSWNKLTSLKGAPISVGGDFTCHTNQLTTLEGCPIEIRGDFYCAYNKLETLEGAPQSVGGNLYFHDNPLQHLNDLNNVQIKGKIHIQDKFFNHFIKALHNTNLDTLEYTLSNHTYWFKTDSTKKDFYMYLEHIIIKKRLELEF